MFKAAGARFDPISTGVTFVGHPMYYLPDVKDSPLEFKTVFMPAYGVVFRAHGGTPHETALLFRAGCNSGHWDADPLNVILYGKGAPLSPGTGYQYYDGVGTHNGAVYHNRVRVRKHSGGELFGRVDVTIADYGFGPNADYAMADRYLPPQYFGDDREGTWWRHVLFLKSDRPEGPSYFVMRDTFPGAEHPSKWWIWLNLDLPVRLVGGKGGMFVHRSTDGPDGKYAVQKIDNRSLGMVRPPYFLQSRPRMLFAAHGERPERVTDPTKPTGEPRVVLQPESAWETRNGDVTERPWMIKHNGRYYLLYSGSGADTPDYAVGYATSTSPLGPFTRAEHSPILHRGDGLFGPGHGCAIRDGGGQWWFVYHQKRTARREWDRFICLDPLRFDEQGRLHGRASRGEMLPRPTPERSSAASP